MIQDFLIPFATIALAEMGDKTQLAMMALAAKYRHTMQIFLGAMLASVIVDGSAVALGSYFSKYLPTKAVSIAAGTLFILFGIYSLLAKEEEGGKIAVVSKRSVFIAAFALFFVSEFGDKSQLAALLFGTQYNLLLTILGTLMAIAVLLALMLATGRYIRAHINEKKIKLLSSALFILIGLFTLLRALVISS